MKKAAANADVVIVTMHAGAEGTGHTHVRPGTEMFLGENRGNVGGVLRMQSSTPGRMW